MLRLVFAAAAATMLSLPAAAQTPTGVLSVDCALEIRRYCREAANPSAHVPCLQTQVKDPGPLCRASMARNNVRPRK